MRAGSDTDAARAGGMAMRALRRRLSNLVYARMLDDQRQREQLVVTSRVGTPGNDSVSSAADSHPDIDSSDKPHPGPATSNPRTKAPIAS